MNRPDRIPYDREEERRLRALLERGETAVCPRCGTAMEARDVPPSGAVSYVRRRVLWVCGRCGGSLVVDRRPGAGDG